MSKPMLTPELKRSMVEYCRSKLERNADKVIPIDQRMIDKQAV